MKACFPIQETCPPSETERWERLLGSFKELDIRLTQKRLEILRSFLSSERPLSIAEAVASSENLKKCELSTIYRFVNQLQRVGIMQVMGCEATERKYLLLLEPRRCDFLICQICRHVEALQKEPAIDSWQKRVIGRTGFKSVTRWLKFYGNCPRCTFTV